MSRILDEDEVAARYRAMHDAYLEANRPNLEGAQSVTAHWALWHLERYAEADPRDYRHEWHWRNYVRLAARHNAERRAGQAS